MKTKKKGKKSGAILKGGRGGVDLVDRKRWAEKIELNRLNEKKPYIRFLCHCFVPGTRK